MRGTGRISDLNTSVSRKVELSGCVHSDIVDFDGIARYSKRVSLFGVVLTEVHDVSRV